MKVQKLGIEWGAAFEEACPVRIQHNGTSVTLFVAESGELIVELPIDAIIESNGLEGFRVRIPT